MVLFYSLNKDSVLRYHHVTIHFSQSGLNSLKLLNKSGIIIIFGMKQLHVQFCVRKEKWLQH